MSEFSISSGARPNELKFVNEELRSTLTKLEASEQELQTKNQELQASEEELRVINEELQATLDENCRQIQNLADLTNDLQNLLSATDSATLLLDRRLCIVRFTPRLAN